MRKIIFLDIDGVLNCAECFKKHHDEWITAGKPEKNWDMLEDKHIEILQRIVKKTEAEVVLSSTWRQSEKSFALISKKVKN